MDGAQNKYFATGGSDALVVIWDMYEMIPVKTLTKVERKVRNLSYSHDGAFLAVTSENYSVQIFRADPVDHQLKDFIMD